MPKYHNKTGRSIKKPQYVLLPYAMLRHPAWRNLRGSALKVLLELHMRFHGTNNGDLSLGLDVTSKTLGMGKATAKAAFDELVARGFLKLTKKGCFVRRHASTYALTYERVGANAPANDWQSWIEPTKKAKPRKAWGAAKRAFPPPPKNIPRSPNGTYSSH